MGKVYHEHFINVLLLFVPGISGTSAWFVVNLVVEVFGLRSQRRGDRLTDTFRQWLDARLIPGDQRRLWVKCQAASGGGGGGNFWLLTFSFTIRNVFPLRECSDADCEKAAKYANASCSFLFFLLFRLSFLSLLFSTCVYLNAGKKWLSGGAK